VLLFIVYLFFMIQIKINIWYKYLNKNKDIEII